MEKKFDFSKAEDQKEFKQLPPHEKEEGIVAAREEADAIRERAQTMAREEEGADEQSTAESEHYKKASAMLDRELFERLPASEQERVIGKEQEEGGEFNKGMEKFIFFLSHGEVDDALEIKNTFSLPEEMVQAAAEKEFISTLSSGYIYNAFKVKNTFSLPEEIIARPDIQAAAEKRFISTLSSEDIDSALKIKDGFNLSEEAIEAAINRVLVTFLENGDMDAVRAIGRGFKLSEEEVFSRPEIIEAAKKGLMASLEKGHTKFVSRAREVLHFVIQPSTIIEQVSGVRELLEKLDIVSPDFRAQAEKSVDVLLALIPFKKNPKEFFASIETNPFLAEAITENPRFGSKLLLKYPEFDEDSKENIEFLFNAKRDILAHNPDIDPESLEFRQAMQEKLKGYKNNQEILDAAEARGINVSEWLNYGETKYFNFEAGESLAFSETVSTPIERIRETIGAYAHGIKETMKEYKAELAAYAVPLDDAKEIEATIATMQEEKEKAIAEGNERKAQGIQKGIESMQKKAENIKTVPAWDKLLGDIDAFQRLKEDVHQAHEKLMTAEKAMGEILSGKMPSGKAVQALKRMMTAAKEELRSKFGILERRIEEFKERLPKTITPALGDERTNELIFKIEQNLAEQFTHYNIDRSDLANIFSEKVDVEKEKMEHRPMSIFVWARNPDIDLYQGNYSPCCISIESGRADDAHESTIADYNTDLGVQIINIWDEVKNEPVTAAWCWLGEDGEGNSVLVVDNIEANIFYSAAYPEQLTKELFEYMKGYAQSIGVKKIILGKSYNKLPSPGEQRKMVSDDKETSAYQKIGGYNREDEYYFDFHRENSASIIWEEGGMSRGEEKEHARERIEKTLFANITMSELAEDDFAAIKRLERVIYDDELRQGEELIEDIREGNGLAYSITVRGEQSSKKGSELIGYLAAVEDETAEGDPCIYLEDIAVIPEAQGQGVGWQMFEQLIEKLKAKARAENKPVLLDMHLRENSQRFMERHRDDLARMGVTPIEEALVPNYYDEGKDALYKMYEVTADNATVHA